MPRGLHIELTNYIPEPDLVLYGCRPLVPFIPGWHDKPSDDQHFHAPERVLRKLKPVDRPWPRDHRCPVCEGQIGRPRQGPNGPRSAPDLDWRTYCELCGSMAPVNESRAVAQRLEVKLADKTDVDDRAVSRQEEGLQQGLRDQGQVLNEVERRRLWNGYKGGILKAYSRVSNRARAGREFLERIGQLPNFDLILNREGKVIGRWSEIEAGVTDGAAREFAATAPQET